ncbi:MAG: hypothetical protein EAZ07_09100 [Cytophagales bacterium]|nr:MAG: hypothetical protein EAZ07_09100 [Cytophagales bacterium]
MKKILLSLPLLLCTLFVNAQALTKGDGVLNLGIGFGGGYVYSGATTTVPPVHASFEKIITDEIGPGRIGIGGLAGYSAGKYEYPSWFGTGEYGIKTTSIVIGARGAYHFNFVKNDKLDLYAGIMLGYNIGSTKWYFDSSISPATQTLLESTNSASYGGLIYGGFIGARYLFTEKIGAFAELGYSIALFNLGLTVKF